MSHTCRAYSLNFPLGGGGGSCEGLPPPQPIHPHKSICNSCEGLPPPQPIHPHISICNSCEGLPPPHPTSSIHTYLYISCQGIPSTPTPPPRKQLFKPIVHLTFINLFLSTCKNISFCTYVVQLISACPCFLSFSCYCWIPPAAVLCHPTGRIYFVLISAWESFHQQMSRAVFLENVDVTSVRVWKGGSGPDSTFPLLSYEKPTSQFLFTILHLCLILANPAS